ncbi:MAG: hypothetical protein AAF492_18360, partial [Verrucomicrobiota bacterium]
NNLLQAEGGQIYDVLDGGTLVTDYNNIIRRDNALVGIDRLLTGAEGYGTVTDWQLNTGRDTHSLAHRVLNSDTMQPDVADELGLDFHPMSENARYMCSGSPGYINIDTNGYSALIDTGNPATDFSGETAPNGDRVNIGPFGNTDQSSLSDPTPWITMISFNDGGFIDSVLFPTVSVYWAAGNINSGTFRVEYSTDNGLTYPIVVSNGIPFNVDSIQWSVADEPETARGKLRIVWNADTNVNDEVDLFFRNRRQPATWYVNDTNYDAACDVWTFAPCNPLNSGTNAFEPVCSLERILQDFPLLAGDRVFVDSGVYTVTNQLEFTILSRGTTSLVIQVIGTTNDSCGCTGATFVPDSNSVMNAAVTLESSEFVTLSNLKFDGFNSGLECINSRGMNFNDIECANMTNDGFLVSLSPNANFNRCISRDNGGLGMSLVLDQGNWFNGVNVNNARGGFSVLAGVLVLENSIVSVDGPLVPAFIKNDLSSFFLSDYNMIWLTNGALVGIDNFTGVEFPRLNDWQVAIGRDAHSSIKNPGFVNAAAGDFRILSQAGRINSA